MKKFNKDTYVEKLDTKLVDEMFNNFIDKMEEDNFSSKEEVIKDATDIFKLVLAPLYDLREQTKRLEDHPGVCLENLRKWGKHYEESHKGNDTGCFSEIDGKPTCEFAKESGYKDFKSFKAKSIKWMQILTHTVAEHFKKEENEQIR